MPRRASTPPNVVKVYSPNATWAKVKAAVVGASVVIYMGHGNGWPSPYTYDPAYTTKDGFGLNATAGNGDYNNKYYGEPYIATLDLAPGAIVLLHHLCYASGNSEPGNPEPTVSGRPPAGRQLSRPASSRPAPARSSPTGTPAPSATSARCSRPHQSIEDMWRTMPNANGNFVSFPSARTPGATVYQDPITPTSGFYRSLAIGTTDVTTDEVVIGRLRRHRRRPGQPRRPGQRGGRRPTAPACSRRLDTTGRPARRRCRPGRASAWSSEPIQTTAEGDTLVQVQGVDDPTITGYMRRDRPQPRDSAPPVVRVLDPGRPFSPERRLATATRRRSAAGSPNRSPGRCSVKDGGGTVLLPDDRHRLDLVGHVGRHGRRASRSPTAPTPSP